MNNIFAIQIKFCSFGGPKLQKFHQFNYALSNLLIIHSSFFISFHSLPQKEPLLCPIKRTLRRKYVVLCEKTAELLARQSFYIVLIFEFNNRKHGGISVFKFFCGYELYYKPQNKPYKRRHYPTHPVLRKRQNTVRKINYGLKVQK